MTSTTAPRRVLTTLDAVVVGLAAMMGAGIFGALGPAADAAGNAVGWALLVAAVVAACNATASARLAARYPEVGGTYVYGRERLGEVWGFLAGWMFVVGKVASCAAVALTFGAYAWPAAARPVAVGVVVVLTAFDVLGARVSALLARWLVAVVLAVLVVVVLVALPADAAPAVTTPGGSPHGVLAGAGLLFFAFAGYARIATLGGEVRDAERAIPRAVAVALTLTLLVYAAVLAATVHVLGIGGLAASAAPLADAVEAAGAPGLRPAVQVGAALAAGGSLLALLLGVSRTASVMARDRWLPPRLGRLDARTGVPTTAVVAVGVVVAVLVATADLRGAIGFSSFGVLVYYGIANASAWTLGGVGGRVVAAVGVVGCAAVAVSLGLVAVAAGVGVLVAGLVVHAVVDGRRRPSSSAAG